MLPHPISPKYVSLLATHILLGLPSSLLPSGYPTNKVHAFPFSPDSCYMPRQSRVPRLHHSWRRVQITNLLAMQFSQPSRQFIPLLSKYSSQNPVLKPIEHQVHSNAFACLPEYGQSRCGFSHLETSKYIYGFLLWVSASCCACNNDCCTHSYLWMLRCGNIIF
jgi:hypothetical protein